jgi:hypothetical protein
MFNLSFNIPSGPPAFPFFKLIAANEFWKYVDKLKVKVNNDPSSNISPNEWLTYFKHLMNIDQVNKFTDSSMNLAEFVENYDMQNNLLKSFL